MWNWTHFRHPTDEPLRHVDIYFLATKIICSLSTLNRMRVICGGERGGKRSPLTFLHQSSRSLHITTVTLGCLEQATPFL